MSWPVSHTFRFTFFNTFIESEKILIHVKIFRKVGKLLDFSPNEYFVVLLFQVSAWLSNPVVLK